MTVTLHLPPELEAGLLAEAQARGVPVDTLLQTLIRRFATTIANPAAPAAALEKESDIWVLRSGQPLSAETVEDTLREERDSVNLGSQQ